jgi:hypothetical protein
MTIVKQKAVSSTAHATNLCNYIDSDKAIARDSQNITDIKNWFKEMDETRELFGHNASVRDGKNTLMYHQILAFLPEEADINGGKLTPKDCMAYSKQYTQDRYPNQQIVFALHQEQCREDNTERYAVHMAINRTDLSSGLRLDEGRGQDAKISRANTIKDMDRAWGLKQVQKDEQNSNVHKRQPRGAEKEIQERGGKSYKRNLRLWCNHLLEHSNSLDEFCSELEHAGFCVEIKNDKIYATDKDHEFVEGGAKCSFNLSKLDGNLSVKSLELRYSQNSLAHEIETSIREISKQEVATEAVKAAYINELEQKYSAFRTEVIEISSKGEMATNIKFKAPKIPDALKYDKDVANARLKYRSKAQNLIKRHTETNQLPASSNTQPHTNQPQRNNTHTRNNAR